MEVKVKVQLSTKDLFEFLMRHTYSTTSGFIGLLLSIGGFIGFFYMVRMPGANPVYLGALLVTGLLFTVAQPLMIWKNAKRQSRLYEEEPLDYSITKSGIDVTQGEKKGNSPWDEIIKITSTRNLVMFYTSKVHAYVMPRVDIGENMDQLKAIVRECSQAKFIKM